MANLLVDSRKKRTYDAIVIGSGASGGWAAKELCDKGLKTLVLERGRDVKHIQDYPTASKAPFHSKNVKTFSMRALCAKRPYTGPLKTMSSHLYRRNHFDGFEDIT